MRQRLFLTVAAIALLAGWDAPSAVAANPLPPVSEPAESSAGLVPTIAIAPDEAQVIALGDGEATKDVVDRLIALLFDPDETIRLNAFTSLARLGRPATPLLLPYLTDERVTPLLWSVYNGCGRTPRQASVSDVSFAAIAAMEDPDVDAVLAAGAALPEAGGSRVQTLLGTLSITEISAASLDLVRADAPMARPIISRAAEKPAIARLLLPALVDLAVRRATTAPPQPSVAPTGSAEIRQWWARLDAEERAALQLSFGTAGIAALELTPPGRTSRFAPERDAFDRVRSVVEHAPETVQKWRLEPLKALFVADPKAPAEALLNHPDPRVRSTLLDLLASPYEMDVTLTPLSAAFEARFAPILSDPSPEVRAGAWSFAHRTVVSAETAASARIPVKRDEKARSRVASSNALDPQGRIASLEYIESEEAKAGIQKMETLRQIRLNALFRQRVIGGLDDPDAAVRSAVLAALPSFYPDLSEDEKGRVAQRVKQLQASAPDKAAASAAVLRLSAGKSGEGDKLLALDAAGERTALAAVLQAALAGDRYASETLRKRLEAGRPMDAGPALDEAFVTWLASAMRGSEFLMSDMDAASKQRLRTVAEAARREGRLADGPWQSLQSLLFERGGRQDAEEPSDLVAAAEAVEKNPASAVARDRLMGLIKAQAEPIDVYVDLAGRFPAIASLILTRTDIPLEIRQYVLEHNVGQPEHARVLLALGDDDLFAGHIVQAMMSDEPEDESRRTSIATSPAIRTKLLEMAKGTVAANRAAAIAAWLQAGLPIDVVRPHIAGTLAIASDEAFAALLRAAAHAGQPDIVRDGANEAIARYFAAPVGDLETAARAQLAIDALVAAKIDIDAVLVRALRDPARMSALLPQDGWPTAPGADLLAALDQHVKAGGRLPSPMVTWLKQAKATSLPPTLAVYLETARTVPRSTAAALQWTRLEPGVKWAMDRLYPYFGEICSGSEGGAGGSSLPVFPWPPPAGFSVASVPASFFGANPTLGLIVDRLRVGLGKASADFTYGLFEMPGEGIALMARMERVRADGAPFPGKARWTRYGKPQAGMIDFLGDLFFERPGYFRVIVFAVTDDVKIVASRWARLPKVEDGADELTNKLRDQRLGQRRVVALVYAFKREAGQGLSEWKDGVPSAANQLQKAGVWNAISGP